MASGLQRSKSPGMEPGQPVRLWRNPVPGLFDPDPGGLSPPAPRLRWASQPALPFKSDIRVHPCSSMVDPDPAPAYNKRDGAFAPSHHFHPVNPVNPV